MPDLARTLRSIERVPPMSPAAQQLLRLQGRPDCSLNDFARVVEVDPGLTASVLRSANSAAAAPAQPVHSVRHAVPYLGERTVVALALSSCVPGGMVAPLAAYGAERGALWRHSLRAAMLARDLASNLRRHRVDPDLAFTAGLLHDIGKAVLADVLARDSCARLAEAALSKEADFESAERNEAGLSHAEAGEALVRRWKLPEELQAALRFHHQPSHAPEPLRPLCFVIHAGTMHAVEAGFTAGVDDLCYRLDLGILSIFDLSEIDFSGMLARVDRGCAEALARVGEP